LTDAPLVTNGTLDLMPLPTVQIMQPTLLSRPFHHEGWVYEEKVDGYRMVAYKAAQTVKLISRNGQDHTKRFPGIVAALRKSRIAQLILDGEIAIYDRQLISRFEWLRHSAPPELATPPLFLAFDCLHARSKDLRSESLYERRNVLVDLLGGQDLLLPVRRLSDDGRKAWQEVLERGYEGLVAKDPQSPYVGGRTLKWLKVKVPKYREVERGFYKP
jgi:bifunctional non-homologous end joining protein LigD